MNVNLAICFPFAGRYVAPQWSVAMQTMFAPMNCNHTVITCYNMQRDNARNGLVQKALEIGAKYILFVDDDTNPVSPNPTEALGALVYEMDNSADDVAVIGGVYVTKSIPSVPTILKDEGTGPHWKWRVGEVFPVFAVGTGFMLIKADVFRKIPQPWFVDVNNVEDAKKYGVLPEDTNKGPIERFQMTDDVFFCRKLRDHGYKVLVHGGVLCQHWDQNGRSYELPKDSWPYLGRERHTPSLDKPISPELASLRAQHPYPDEKPYVDLSVFPAVDWADQMSQDTIAELIPKDAKCIVELGTWVGYGAKRMASRAPDAQVICIDHWQGSLEHWQDERFKNILPQLYRGFTNYTWDLRHRIIPVKASTILGMHEVASAGIKPDFIYIDASHQYAEVKLDVEMALKLFPGAIICGDDWNWPEVQQAVTEVLGERNVKVRGLRTWWYDPVESDHSLPAPVEEQAVEEQAVVA